jgi:hypothetical protein
LLFFAVAKLTGMSSDEPESNRIREATDQNGSEKKGGIDHLDSEQPGSAAEGCAKCEVIEARNGTPCLPGMVGSAALHGIEHPCEQGKPGNGLSLSDVEWVEILRKAEAFAETRLERYSFRGTESGVVPEGEDAQSLAAGAVLKVLEEDHPKGAIAEPTANGQIESGQTKTLGHLVDEGREIDRTPKQKMVDVLDERLRALIYRRVDSLRHRRENWLVRNEVNLPLQRLCAADETELGTAAEALEEPGLRPDEALMQKEAFEEIERFISAFRKELGDKTSLKAVLGCLVDGITKAWEIAGELVMTRSMASNLLWRLRQELTGFMVRRGKEFEYVYEFWVRRRSTSKLGAIDIRTAFVDDRDANSAEKAISETATLKTATG